MEQFDEHPSRMWGRSRAENAEPVPVIFRPSRRADVESWLSVRGYASIAAAATARGLAQSTVRTRLARGATLDRAFGPNLRRRGVTAVAKTLRDVVGAVRGIGRADPALVAAALAAVEDPELRRALRGLLEQVGAVPQNRRDR